MLLKPHLESVPVVKFWKIAFIKYEKLQHVSAKKVTSDSAKMMTLFLNHRHLQQSNVKVALIIIYFYSTLHKPKLWCKCHFTCYSVPLEISVHEQHTDKLFKGYLDTDEFG